MNYEIDIQIEDDFLASVDAESLRAVAQRTLRACNVDRATLTIVITDDEEIRTLNREYRNVDAATDVLSFPNSEGEEDGAQTLALPPELAAEAASYLGDIIIAYPYTARQAEKYGVAIAAELRLMTVHGVLHLLGYDHATGEDEAVMWQLQAKILSTFGDNIDLGQRTYHE